jgi:hypothetical protein
VLLALSALLLAACSLSPLRFLTGSRATAQPVITLARCDDREDVLCLVTFGLEPPDQMLIVLRASPGLPEALEAVVTYKDEPRPYPCERAEPSLTAIYCSGPQPPLGSSMRIEVYATEQRTLLAAGDFVLMALALPTVSGGGTPNPTASPQLFPTPTRTSGPVRLSPTPSPRGTAAPTRTPGPGTAYPNPNQ